MESDDSQPVHPTVRKLAKEKQGLEDDEEPEDADTEAPINFVAFYDYYEGNLSRSTLSQYIYYLDYLDFDPLAPETSPSVLETEEFSLEDFDLWAKEKSEEQFGSHPEDENKRLRMQKFCYFALKKYLKSQQRKDLLALLPDSENIAYPESGTQKLTISEEQVEKMLEQIKKKDQFSTQDAYCITLMFYGGMRAKPVLNSTFSWFEFQETKQRIELELPAIHAKGKKHNRSSETVFLPWRKRKPIMNHLTEFHEVKSLTDFKDLDQEERAVCVVDFSPNGDSNKTFEDLRTERFYLNKMLKSVAEKAGLNISDRISAHKLRGSFIKACDEKLDSLSRVAKQSRHSDVETTLRYLDREKEQKAQDHEKVFN
jgi:integrase